MSFSGRPNFTILLHYWPVKSSHWRSTKFSHFSYKNCTVLSDWPFPSNFCCTRGVFPKKVHTQIWRKINYDTKKKKQNIQLGKMFAKKVNEWKSSLHRHAQLFRWCVFKHHQQPFSYKFTHAIKTLGKQQNIYIRTRMGNTLPYGLGSVNPRSSDTPFQFPSLVTRGAF